MNDPYYNSTIPDHVPAECVYDFNLYDPEFEDLDLFFSIRRLHEIGLPEIFWTRHNGGHWVVRRGEVISAITRDHELFSSKRMLVPDEQNFETDFFVPLVVDPPEHSGYRAIAAPLFAPPRIKELEPRIRQFTGELIDELKERGECEFMADFALQMPIVVFLQFLDLPIDDRLYLLDIANRVVRPPPEGERRDDAMQDMFDYLRPILAERSANPGDDVISRLVTGKLDGQPLTPEQMLGLAATILTGGLDTVAATLGFITRYLADTPEARQRLASDPSVISRAIEELMRRFPPTTHGRSITRSTPFREVQLKKGEHIVWTASLFNFDEEQFENPMAVDFDRPRAPHLSFGSGIHFCAGAFLARAEIRIFIEEWLKRIPEFSIRDGVTVRYRPGINIAYHELPLVWPT